MISCNICTTPTNEELPFCSVCNYPLQGSEEEKASFVSTHVLQKSAVVEAIDRLKKVRYLLFFLGAFYLIIPNTPLLKNPTPGIIMILMSLGVILVAFGFMTFKKPKIALAIPLFLISLYYIYLFLLDPALVWRGILWKIIIIVLLGYGFFSVRKSDKILRENTYLASLFGFHYSDKK